MSRLTQLRNKVNQKLKANAAEPESNPVTAPVNPTVKAPEDETQETTTQPAGVNVDSEAILSEAANKLNLADEIGMTLLKSQTEASWLISAGVEPIALIALTDQENPSEIANHFVTDDFRADFLEAANKIGWQKPLTTFQARIYSNNNQTIKLKSHDDMAGEVEKDFNRFTRTCNIAIVGMAKNLVPSPMKAKLFDVLAGLGCENPNQIVEEIYDQGGTDTLNAIFSKALELKSYSDDALTQLENSFGSFEKRILTSEDVVDEDEDEANTKVDKVTDSGAGLASTLDRGSVPLVTHGSSPAHDRRSRFRQALRG